MLSGVPAIFVVAAVLKWMPESDVWRRTRDGLERGIGIDWRAMLAYRRIFAMLFVVVLLNSEAYWFTYTWMPGYLELKRGLTAAAASRLLIKMQIGGVIGYLTFGRVADRFGRRPAFCAYGLLMATGTIPPTILWNSAVAVRGLISAAMFTAGFGTGIWAGIAPMIAEMLPTRIRNTSLGLDPQRHAGIPVLHADSDSDARRSRRFRRDAIARRRVLDDGRDAGVDTAGDARTVDHGAGLNRLLLQAGVVG